MGRKQGYYRTAALLGAQPGHVPVRARRTMRTRQPVRIPWKLLLLATPVFVLLGWLILGAGWYVTAERLHVSGATSLAVARAVAVETELLGMHGLLLREAATADVVLMGQPGLISARVECQRFPAECVIYVEERKPVLTWHTEAGTYWIDAEGVLFPAYETRGDLPQIAGPLPASPARLRDVWQGVEALLALGVSTNELEYNSERGLVWTDSEGRRVAFGVGDSMQARWDIYRALVAHLEAQRIFPWAMDVRFPGGPTYSLDQTW